MSENQAEGFGDYHPEAAGHGPYNDAMAAWRNQVRAMQDEGTLPPSQEPAEGSQESEPTQDPDSTLNASQEGAEGDQGGDVKQRSVEDAPDLNEDGTAKEGDPESADETMSQRDEKDGDGGEAESGGKPYDPSEHNAPEVIEYLRGVGEQEAKRVLDAEEQGRARKGLLNAREDLLRRSRKNDETQQAE